MKPCSACALKADYITWPLSPEQAQSWTCWQSQWGPSLPPAEQVSFRCSFLGQSQRVCRHKDDAWPSLQEWTCIRMKRGHMRCGWLGIHPRLPCICILESGGRLSLVGQIELSAIISSSSRWSLHFEQVPRTKHTFINNLSPRSPSWVFQPTCTT